MKKNKKTILIVIVILLLSTLLTASIIFGRNIAKKFNEKLNNENEVKEEKKDNEKISLSFYVFLFGYCMGGISSAFTSSAKILFDQKPIFMRAFMYAMRFSGVISTVTS